MIATNMTQVYGYIPKTMKARLKRIRQVNRDYSESSLVGRGLGRVISEVEKELGIRGPVQETPSDDERAE